MKKKAIYVLIFTFLVISGCSKDYDLGKTVFFSDPDYPDLPMYSEWGYNTFGAYYDRKVFTSANDITPLKVIVKDGYTFFRFSGRLNSYQEMTMIFSMDDFLPDTYDELIYLDNKSIDLKDPHYSVIVIIDDVEQLTTLLNGHLDFKKAQNLIVDKVAEEVILSGVFEFQLVVDDEPFTISRGRFDMGVGYDNFFKF